MAKRAWRWACDHFAAAWHSPAVVALAVITLIGALLRFWFLLHWRPALVGFPDTAAYVVDAASGLFADPLRISGYVLFLRLVHGISPHLSVLILVQHAMGLVTGILFFDAMRRAGVRIGLGLVPAAVIMLGGTELFLEHAPLTEPVFIFCVALGLWFTVRAWMGNAWWAAGAGLSFGYAAIDHSVGLTLVPVAVACLLLAPASVLRSAEPASERRSRLGRLLARHVVAVGRVARAALATIGALAVILPFAYAHQQATGSFGFTSNGYLALYSRVAPWVDCSKFTPPAGTAFLCPTTPVAQRPGNDYWEFAGISPAVDRWGSPEWFGPKPPPSEDAELKAFSVAAIEAQPLTYLEWVGRDLIRIIEPDFTTSPYPSGAGNPGYGLDPQGVIAQLLDESNIGNIDAIIDSYYDTHGNLNESIQPLITLEQDTRLDGPLMVIVLLLALLAPFLASGGARRVAITLGLFTLVLLLVPILTVSYDYRYTVPAFGELTATAAIGGYELWRRLSPPALRAWRGRGRLGGSALRARGLIKRRFSRST